MTTLADIHKDAFYKASDVADVFGICVDTVYGMAAKGILTSTRLGPQRGLLRFKGADIIECATKRAEKRGHDVPATTTRDVPEPEPRQTDVRGFIEAGLAMAREHQKLLDELRFALQNGDDAASLALARRLCGLPPSRE